LENKITSWFKLHNKWRLPKEQDVIYKKEVDEDKDQKLTFTVLRK
jgi:hypothetical protein